MTRILVIDDNDLDRKIIRDVLTYSGFEVEEAADGMSGLRRLYDMRPDLIILDVMMPEMSGWTVCSRVRELCATPVMMLTSLHDEEEIVRGLELGADDFLSKPISAVHLLARVRALLRRSETQPASGDLVYDDGELRIEGARHEVRVDGKLVELTPTELRLLFTLASRPNRVHLYSELLQQVWGDEYRNDIDFLRVYIWRLRKKIEKKPEQPRWLVNDRGFGYRFVGHPG